MHTAQLPYLAILFPNVSILPFTINGIISLPSSPYPTTIFCDSFSLDTQAPFSYTRSYQKRTSHKFPEDKVIIGEKYRDYVGKIRPKDIVLRF